MQVLSKTQTHVSLWLMAGTAGQGDMKLTYGIIAVKLKAKQGREDKVGLI